MYIARVLTSWRKSNREGIEEKKKNRRRGDISGLFFLNTQQTHDKWWGFGGARRKKNRTRLFKDQEGSFNYTVVALQFVTCDNKKGRNHDKKKKTQEMKSKVKTNHFLLVIRFPPQSTIPQSSLLPLISIQHSHEAIRLQRLK